jgi:hypothetical protein
MTEPGFEQALAACLRDLDEGRATFDECVERWPEFTHLERHLALRAAVGTVSVPRSASIRGRAAMQEALRAQAARTAPTRSLLRTIPRAVVAAGAALVLFGGAMGASAAAGGPTILPDRLLSAFASLGFPGLGETASPTATPAGHPGSASGVEPRGLCTAFLSGSDRGRDQKAEASSFGRLTEAARQAGLSVEAYCATLPTSVAGTDAQGPGSGGGSGRQSTGNGPSATTTPNGRGPNDPGPKESSVPTPTATVTARGPSDPGSKDPAAVRPSTTPVGGNPNGPRRD